MSDLQFLFDWLKNIIKEATSKQFYGKIHLHFEAGRLVHIKREETLKPPVLDKTHKTQQDII